MTWDHVGVVRLGVRDRKHTKFAHMVLSGLRSCRRGQGDESTLEIRSIRLEIDDEATVGKPRGGLT